MAGNSKSWRGRAGILLGGISILALHAGAALANPQGGTVVAGDATISVNGNTLTIDQTTNRAIVNWQAFSVGAGQTTQINLPSSLSAILNRVTGADPSLIAGQLNSNGQVYLINPNGVVVGQNGQIDTGAFIASTLDVPDGQFLAGGGMTFSGDSGAGIHVFGTVRAANGDAVLIAAVVDNQGRIIAPDGQAVLGAGAEVFYVPDGRSDIIIAAPADAASVSNTGAIDAASAQLRAAGSAYALAVNNGGVVSATGVSTVGGRVVLDGGAGNVSMSGGIESAGGDVSIAGGDITITGAVDVSAAGAGDGGSVVAIADGVMDYRGAIAARGGAQGGDGGFAEVSGRTLGFAGTVSLVAPLGATGNLLLDPVTLDICDSCATTPASIAAALSSANTTLQADQLITVNSPISSSSTNMLVFNAKDVSINSGITLAGTFRLINGGVLGLGGALSSDAGAAIDVGRFEILANYFTIDLAGTVATPVLRLAQPDVTAVSIRIRNRNNAIAALDATGINELTGPFDFRTNSALAYTGSIVTAGNIRLLAAQTITANGGAELRAANQLVVASLGGTFVNNAGAGLVGAPGRKRVYVATDVGLNDGGLGYIQYNPVAYRSDPFPGVDVIYVATASTLPVMTITANNASRTYGQADPAFGWSYSGGTAANLAVGVQGVTLVNGPAINAGTYVLTPFGAISSTRAVRFANGVLTVNKAPLTVTANNRTAIYGSPYPVFDGTASGLVNGDTAAILTGLRYATTAPVIITPRSSLFGGFTIRRANVGTYSITATGSLQNYTITAVPGVFTITPAPLTITANNKSSVYGSPVPAFDASYAGLANGDTASAISGLSLRTIATPGSRVGTYVITASGGASPNYAITHANGTLTVNRAPLIITANDAARMQDAPNPAFSVRYSGLVNGDSGPSVAITFLGTTARPGSPAGLYPIVITGFPRSGIGAGNYDLSFVQGRLTVTAPPPPPVTNTTFGVFTPITDTYTPPADSPTLQTADLDIQTVDLDLPGNTVQINPLFNTPLGPYGPLANNLVDGLAASIQPPKTPLQIVNALDDPATAPAIWGMLAPLMFSQLDSILAKPEAQWTAAERTFVAAFADYMTQQRRAAAAKALADLEAWALQNQAERRASQDRAGGVAEVYQSAIIASSPPVPPAEILQAALSGMTLTDQQAMLLLNSDEVLADVQAVMSGVGEATKIASYGFTFSGYGNLPGDAAVSTKLSRAIYPYYVRNAGGMANLARATTVVGVTGRVIGVAGVVLSVIGNAVQIGMGAALYAQQADYLTAFQSAVNANTAPVTTDMLRGMIGSDGGGKQIMTYLLAQGATGTPDPFSNPLVTGTPTRSFDQIVDVIESM